MTTMEERRERAEAKLARAQEMQRLRREKIKAAKENK